MVKEAKIKVTMWGNDGEYLLIIKKTAPRIVKFRLNLLQTMTTWQPMYDKLWMSRRQGSIRKNVVSQERMGLLSLNFVKISP